jgi:hypothetical protein
MNPSVPQREIDEAMEAGPSSAATEYGTKFRTDVETFISREVVDTAVILGRHELPRIGGANYVAFCDPSGGSSDSMTLAIAHMAADRAILDPVRERRPPFSPDDVAREFAETIKAYGIASIRGDHYGGMWPRERLAVHGVDYQPATQVDASLVTRHPGASCPSRWPWRLFGFALDAFRRFRRSSDVSSLTATIQLAKCVSHGLAPP